MKNKLLSVITAATGDRIVIGKDEFMHARNDHFQNLPDFMLLELIELILKDPTVIYEEVTKNLYHLFYRLEDANFLVVVVKLAKTGCFFCTMYPTGK